MCQDNLKSHSHLTKKIQINAQLYKNSTVMWWQETLVYRKKFYKDCKIITDILNT